MATKDERHGEIIVVSGTDYGFRWEGLCWVLYRWIEFHDKKGVSKGFDWDKDFPWYPTGFRHMAEIIARSSGKDATTVEGVLQDTIAERERLTVVLEKIVLQDARIAGIEANAEG